MSIYLVGNVPKGNEEAKRFDNWRVRYQNELQKHIKADFIDPYEYKLKHDIDEGNYLLAFGTDCNHIKNSDLIIVNAEDKLGVGTAQEIVIAKYFKKPVIVVLPKGIHHRRSNIMFGVRKLDDWIHPFIYCFADFIVENIKDVGDVITRLKSKNVVCCG